MCITLDVVIINSLLSVLLILIYFTSWKPSVCKPFPLQSHSHFHFHIYHHPWQPTPHPLTLYFCKAVESSLIRMLTRER